MKRLNTVDVLRVIILNDAVNKFKNKSEWKKAERIILIFYGKYKHNFR